MYPRIKRIVNDTSSEVVVSYYMKNQALGISKELCVGCGTCVSVCPKNALSQPNAPKLRIKTEEMIPELLDPLKCSYCGTCAYMCPFSAITLKKNDQVIAPDDIEIVKRKVLPKLEVKMVECKNIKRQARVYVEGHIEVDWAKCISCMSCADVCPTGSFFRAEVQVEGQKKPRKVDFNPENCVNCGACEISCAKDAIQLNIDKVNYSGEFSETFWPDLIKRLKKE
jgi:formate hydrogenlyase subunit 6/NADH:ubiquinone oxidoreductase subunit I